MQPHNASGMRTTDSFIIRLTRGLYQRSERRRSTYSSSLKRVASSCFSDVRRASAIFVLDDELQNQRISGQELCIHMVNIAVAGPVNSYCIRKVSLWK